MVKQRQQMMIRRRALSAFCSIAVQRQLGSDVLG
jgi:hypothetical protein